MNFTQRNQAVVDLVTGGYLTAARELAAINVQIVQDEIDAFNRQSAKFNHETDELRKMLDMAAINRYPLPKKLVVGSGLYQSVVNLLQKYTHTLRERGLYEAVVVEFLRLTETPTTVN